MESYRRAAVIQVAECAPLKNRVRQKSGFHMVHAIRSVHKTINYFMDFITDIAGKVN